MQRVLKAALLLLSFSVVAADVACSDPRATNFNGSLENTVDPELNGQICMYPLVRRNVDQWASLQEFCLLAGYDWTYADLTFCYIIGLRNDPPWPRKLDADCAYPNNCTVPLEIDITNVVLTELSFSLETATLTVAMTYALKWSDHRMLGAMLEDFRRIWRPRLMLKAYTYDKTDREQVLLLDRFNGSYINMTHLTAMRYDDTLLSQGNIYVRPGLCEQYEADIQSRGRDLGCCRNVNDTRCGGLSSFSSYVDCATVDSCAVETVNRVTADFFMPNLQYGNFPYDTHNVRLELSVVPPWQNIDPEWWVTWKPPPPNVRMTDMSTNMSICDGSMRYALRRLKISGYSFESQCTTTTNTALVNLLANATDETLRSMPTRTFDMGAGGISIDIKLTRISGYTERYYIFPMLLIGAATCLVPLFNSDLMAFVGTRVGFSFLAILTALAASNDITPVSANGQQFTVVDQLSVLTIGAGGLIAFESLIMYGLWCAYKCTPTDTKGGWFIRTIDYVFAMMAFVAYIWAATIIIFRQKNEKAMWVAVIVGAVFMITALGLSFVVIRRTRPTSHAKETSHTDIRDELEKKNKRFGKDFYNRAAEAIPEAFHRFGDKLKKRGGGKAKGNYAPRPADSDLVVRTTTSGSTHSGGSGESAPQSDSSLIRGQRRG